MQRFEKPDGTHRKTRLISTVIGSAFDYFIHEIIPALEQDSFYIENLATDDYDIQHIDDRINKKQGQITTTDHYIDEHTKKSSELITIVKFKQDKQKDIDYEVIVNCKYLPNPLKKQGQLTGNFDDDYHDITYNLTEIHHEAFTKINNYFKQLHHSADYMYNSDIYENNRFLPRQLKKHRYP